MNRQQLLNNFVNTLDGRGQSVKSIKIMDEHGDYIYVKNNHPGCAIGCQPGFRERFENYIDVARNKGIGVLLSDTDIRNFFEVESKGDEEFLRSLQTFHDTNSNWDENRINRKRLNEFCDRWGLGNPLAKSA